MRLKTFLSVVSMLTLGTGCTSSEDLRSKIDQVEILTNRAAALRIVGSAPSATQVSNLLGAEVITDVWRASAITGTTTTCHLTYFLQRVMAKGCQ